METKRIRLREVQDNDLPIVFSWRNSEKFRYFFHHNETIVTYENFVAEFNEDATVRRFQFIIEKINTNEIIGLTFVHSFSEDGYSCFLNIFLSEQFERKGYGVDAFVLFCLFLFDDVEIKRLYVEAFEFNFYSLATIRRSGMTEVENGQNKRIHNGKQYSVLKFAGDRSILPLIKKYAYHLVLQ